MTIPRRYIIQDHRAFTEGQETVEFDLSEYAPSRLAALQVSGGASASGLTLRVYVTYHYPGRSHVIADTGEVTLGLTLWQVEFLPWARFIRSSDLYHIVPIYAPVLVPEARLHVVAKMSSSGVWINTATLLMEPINGITAAIPD